MKPCQLLPFFSPKSAGSTLVSLNTAMLHQHLHMEKKVAWLQLTRFPDLHIYTGVERHHSLHDLQGFIGTDEWDASLLSKVALHQGCDLIPSPQWSEWEAFEKKDLQAIFAVLKATYDIVYIDLSPSVPTWVLDFVLEQTEQMIVLTTLDPASFAACQIILDQLRTRDVTPHLLLNHASRADRSVINRWQKELDASLLGALPSDPKNAWNNAFMGFPLIQSKRSPLRKALAELVPKLHTL